MEEKVKKLKTMNIVGLGLGGAIGTGIFLLLGYGIAYTGRSIVLVCAVGCFFMLLAYWYQFAIPTMFVLEGGDYSMKTMLFSPLLSGIGAWFTVVGGFAFSGYAIGITDYLGVVIPEIKNYSMICSLVIITLVFAASYRGSRFITILENLVTVLLMVALALFILFGIAKVDAGNFFSSTYDGGFFREGEDFLKLLVPVSVKIGVKAPVKAHHVKNSGGGEIEPVVGDDRQQSLLGGVLIDRLALHQHLAAVGGVDTGQMTDDRGLACAVGAHQAIDAAVGNGDGCAVQSSKAVKGFDYIFYFNHCFSSSSTAVMISSLEKRRHRSSAISSWSFCSSSWRRASRGSGGSAAKLPLPGTE